MDDRINNLKLVNKKLNTLVLALNTIVLELEKLNETKCGRDELWKEVEGLQKKVDYQKCQIEDYHEHVEEGKVEFEKVSQNSKILSNRVLGEKKKVFLVKRNRDATRTLSSNFQRSLSYQILLQHWLQIW